MAMLSLPNEVLILIASSIERRRDQVNLARSCKHFYDLLMPIAFAEISVRSDSVFCISCLAHLLLRNARYAHAIRHLTLTDFLDPDKRNLRFKRTLILDAVRPLTLTEEELVKWEKSLRGKISDIDYEQRNSWHALFLAILPNLEVLKFNWDHGFGHRQMVMERASARLEPFDTRPIMTRLKKVHIGQWESCECSMGLALVLPIMRLPLMVHFSCVGLEDDTKRDPSVTFSFPNMTHLCFHFSNSKDGFARLIDGCGKLSSFIYEHTTWPYNGEPLDMCALYRAIVKHKDTLEELTILNSMAYHTDEALENAVLGKVNEFRSLRKLWLRAINMRDWKSTNGIHLGDAFPMSLKSLVIDGIDSCPHTLELVEQMEDYFRNHIPDEWDPDSLQVRGYLVTDRIQDIHSAPPGKNLLKKGMISVGYLLNNVLGGKFSMYDYTLEDLRGYGLIPREWYIDAGR